MRYSLVILLLFTGINAFSQVADAEKRVKKGIAGTWYWRKTLCCNMGGGSLKLADASKKEKTVVLTKDSIIKIYNEDQLAFEGRYKLDEIRFLKDPVSYNIHSQEFNGMLKFIGDTMLVGYCASDGCDEYFVQKKQKIKKRKTKRK